MRKLIPAAARRSLRTAHRNFVLQRSLRRLRALPEDATPDRRLFEDLIYGWGNPQYSALVEFADGVMQHAGHTRGRILECGSGITTLLLGIAAERTGSRVWTLENSDDWADKVEVSLRRAKIETVDLVRSPIRDFGDFAWYAVPLDRLPPLFDLVVCDGPVAAYTKGGRYGLLPVLGDRLAPGCQILLDDAGRMGESVVIRTWALEFGAEHTIHGAEKPYAAVRFPARWEGAASRSRGYGDADQPPPADRL